MADLGCSVDMDRADPCRLPAQALRRADQESSPPVVDLRGDTRSGPWKVVGESGSVVGVIPPYGAGPVGDRQVRVSGDR